MKLWQLINKIWRIIATGFCFVLFGLGGLGLSFLVFPIFKFLIKNKEQREIKAQGLIQISFFLFSEIMRLLGAIDYKIVGIEKLKEDKNCLIVGNHPSLIDFVLIASRLKQCNCLVKEAIWHNPFMKGVVTATGYIPNKDPEVILDSCATILNKGQVLLVFPEGTRTKKNVAPILQRGAAQVAVKTQSDLRVVHITVDPIFLTKEMKWYNVPAKKPLFLIEVKEKIAISDFISDEEPYPVTVRKLNRHLENVIFPNKR